MENTYVLDAWALIGFFKSEPTARPVRDLFESADRGEVKLFASVVNVGEMFYKTARQSGRERADTVMTLFEDYTVEVVSVDWPLAFAAARLKSVHRISYADCIAAALAQRLEARLVTGDSGLRGIPDLQIEWLG